MTSENGYPQQGGYEKFLEKPIFTLTVILNVFNLWRDIQNTEKFLSFFPFLSSTKFQNPSDSYKFGTVTGKGIATSQYFKYHNSESFRNMHKFMVKHSVANADEGIDRVLNGLVETRLKFINNNIKY